MGHHQLGLVAFCQGYGLARGAETHSLIPDNRMLLNWGIVAHCGSYPAGIGGYHLRVFAVRHYGQVSFCCEGEYVVQRFVVANEHIAGRCAHE